MPFLEKSTDTESVNSTCSCNVSKFKGRTSLILLFSILLFYTANASKTKVKRESVKTDGETPTHRLPPSCSKLGRFTKSAVCLDGAPCVDIGKEILLKNGSAVDAIIAVMLCNGMVSMQSMSIGGGFFMLIYIKHENKVYCVNAREKAPQKARNALYKNEPEATSEGPLSIAVPGELKGYQAIHKKFGKLSWKNLVQPTIDLCEKGYIMSCHQFKSLKIRKEHIGRDENLRQWFYDSHENFKTAGSKIIPTRLCKTLRILAKNGPDDFYTGQLSKMVLEDINEAGGIITEQDLRDYEIDWEEPYELKLNNGDKLFSAPPPASGAILGLIINTLSGFNLTKDSMDGVSNTITSLHRIIEVFKYAYARRSELGDPKFVNLTKLLSEISSKEYADSIRQKIKDNETHSDPSYYGGDFYSNVTDHGTSHITLIAPNGDAVSVTSSLNIFFGAGLTSKRTGIVLNSQMDDFSYPWKVNYFNLPGSPKNQMEPGKRPLSSMSPCIILDSNNDIKLVVGAAGGSQITTSVALTLMRTLWFENNIKEAIDAPRVHHQLLPMEVLYEDGILQQVIDGLRAKGHTMKRGIKSNVCGLQKDKLYVYGNADFRKGGNVLGFD